MYAQPSLRKHELKSCALSATLSNVKRPWACLATLAAVLNRSAKTSILALGMKPMRTVAPLSSPARRQTEKVFAVNTNDSSKVLVLTSNGSLKVDALFEEMRTLSRSSFEVQVVGSTSEAIGLLASCSVDFLVVDAHEFDDSAMTECFDAARRDSPKTSRLAIQPSANTGTQDGTGTQGVLSLDMDPQDARLELHRVLRIQEVISQPAVSALVGDNQKLPATPTTYRELNRLASSPKSSMRDFSNAIEKDPAIATEVLRLANTTFFGRMRRIDSLFDAIQRLGLDLVKGLAVGAHTFETLGAEIPKGFSMSHFQKYSLSTALLAREFSPNAIIGQTSFTAGLLLDVGKLIIARSAPNQFSEVLALVSDGTDEDEAERTVLNTTHSAVGGYLLDQWRLSDRVVESTIFHAKPSQTNARSPVLAATHAAGALLGILLCGDAEDTLDVEFLEECGLASKIPQWREKAEEVTSMF